MSKKRITLFYLLAVFIILLDQLTKYFARQLLAGDKTVEIIGGFLDFKLTFNQGAAFGTMPTWAPLFIIVTLIVIFAIFRLKDSVKESPVLATGLGLLLGGSIGNLIDRIFRSSEGVTDFIDAHIGSHSWPTFNIADSSIVIGIVLVFYYVYVIQKRQAETQ